MQSIFKKKGGGAGYHFRDPNEPFGFSKEQLRYGEFNPILSS
jgi:hypothetical protein